MKRILLLVLGACALTGNVNAQTVWQQMGAAEESQARAAHRQANAMEIQAGAAQTQANVAVRQEMREEAKEWAAAQEALAQAKAEHEKWVQKMYRQQDLRNQARDAAFAEDAKSNPFYHTDALPQLTNFYDDATSIRLYLHDSGYSDISDAEIQQISAYMHAHGIRHVSQLSQ